MLTSNQLSQRRHSNGAHREATRAARDGHVAPAPALDLIADGLAAFAAAPDLSALARALARQLARAASADRTTVWLVEPTSGDRLTLAAAWPQTGAPGSAAPLALAEASWAQEAFRRGAALRTRMSEGPAVLGLDGRRDALLWVVPLLAGGRRLGLAYAVASHLGAHDDDLGCLLTIFGTQAALAAQALAQRQAVRQEDAEFLAVVAHDLKNVVTSVKGYTQLIRRHLPAETAPRAGRWAGIVEEQAGVLASTLSALVDLGRLHCGRVPLEYQPVDLRALVEAIAARLPAADDAPPLRLRLPAGAVLGTWDPARLERALAAALDSLRRAAPPEAAALDVTVDADDAQARLCVGAATPAEPWPAAGEWASGAEATLYLLRGVIEAHGGRASYRRTADGRPLLQVRLPLQPPAS